MSHEYVTCKMCRKPVMEHLANHTEQGSLCDACYNKSGLREKAERELAESMKTCTVCGRAFLKRNFATPYPEDMCRQCGEAEVKNKEAMSRDVDFKSDENQARDIVLGFICKDGKREGLRVLKRDTGKVVQIPIPDELKSWNLNINGGNLYAKCCKLSDFPQLTLPAGVTGNPFDPNIKLVTKQSGAWVLEELPNKIFRLVSVSGQIKDVAEQTALNFHNAYKIANAEVVDGRLTGMFRKPEDVVAQPKAEPKAQETPKVADAPKKVLSAQPQITPEELAQMKALNEELKAACKAYYQDNDSPLTDLEYDQKFDQLLALEHKTGYVLPDSVTQGVGSAVTGKLPKVEHKDKVLSLDKTKDTGALKALLEQDLDGEVGVLSWKMDGLTIVATYKDGVLKQALTRGDGRIGEDVTHNAKFFKNMPRRIPYTGEVRVRGEAVIAYSTFERINATLPEGQEPYKNPRNLASGLVRRSEVTRDGSVEFVPFGVAVEDPKFKPKSYAQALRFLEGQGFKPVEHILCTPDSVEQAVEHFKAKIANFDYPTDGLVLSIDDVFVYEKLGTTGRHPRGSLAFKWADEKQKTILRSIEWSASRTGVLTPVAIFDPVELEGTTVKRASVHNLTMLRRLKLGIGDEISIYKANMIIPQIAENHTQSDTVQPPAVCPVCGGKTSIRKDGESEFVMCTNSDCAAKNVGLLAHFVKREAMNIDGISEKSIEQLVSAGFIGKPVDFYKLKDHPEIQELPGWGKSSYNKLLYAIEASRKPRLANFIYALGIKNVGRSASDTLASHFRTLDAFLSATAEEIGQVDGIGSGMTADIMAYKTKHEADIRELAKAVNIVNPDDEVSSFNSDDLAGIPKGAPNCLAGLTFCVTGKVDFPGARNALAEYIKSLGGKFGTSVTKNTDYLITNTPNSGSAKNQNAQKLGVKVIPESAFYLLVEELSKKVTASAEPASAEPVVEPEPAPAEPEKEMTQGEKIVKAGVDAVVIPENPREARIQAANVLQAFSGVPLAGLTFCVTGKVNYGTREAFFRLIESNGGKTSTSMTRGVDYLITNDPYSGSNKNRRARELGAKVISEREFFEMLNRV